ncbi:MAG: methyltransferase domain-containing protein [Methanothrix sp.]|nr:methyltransferase domain-containing protein [Methanothrix sp.]
MLENIKQNFEQVLESDQDASDLRSLSISLDTFYALSSAIEVGIFQGLMQPKSSSELAEELGLHTEITDKLCKALASRGYLFRGGSNYALSDLARTFLTESSPFYQGSLIKLMQRTRAQRWSNLSRALKEGPIAAPSGLQVFDEFFSLAMAEGAVGGPLQRTIRVLKERPEFHKARRCLDLGGSHGLYSLAFTRSNPELEVVLFDLPKVIDGAAKKVVSDSERIVTMAGDFNRDDLGKDYDLVFASDVLYRQEESLRPLLARIRESLKQDGLLICKHFHIDDLISDSSAVLFDLMFSISGTGGVVYSSADFCRLLVSSGFSVIQVEDISSSVSPSKIIMARKVQD